jgi:phage terminase large subunit-like protein
MKKEFVFLQEDETFYFDHDAVERVIRFIETLCKLSEPRGKPFVLLPWQRQIVNDIFGWKRRDNDERRFQNVYIEVPRKNGKTYFVAALLLYLLMADGVSGAEVYASACTREQSGILFKSVQRMIQQNKFFLDRLIETPSKNKIEYPKGDGVLKALSGDSVGSHGKHPSAVVCDELHEWTTPKSEALYEALTSGFGNRKSPLVIHITTAGYGSQPTLAKRLHDKAKVFAEGTLEDESFYGVIYGAEQTDDWTDEAVWKKANPSYSLVSKTLKRELAAATLEPSKQNTFCRLYLNIWTQQQTRWLDLAKYDACVKAFSLEEMKGQDVILGCDWGQIYDLTAISLIFPSDWDKWKLAVKTYMPEQQMLRRTKEDNVPYESWHKRGYLDTTIGISKGLTLDYPTLIEQVKEIATNYNVVALGYDPSQQSINIIPQLEEIGINCFPIYQSHKEMSPASKEFERRLIANEIEIEDNPCLRWQAGNVEVEYRQDLIRPIKPNQKQGFSNGTAKYKVDAIVASIIGIQTTLLAYRNRKQETEDKPQIFFV